MIGFALFYLFAIPLSLLPLRILYMLSDVLYVIVYRIVGYRKAIVRSNLKQSFPTKTATELVTIEQAYYHNLCDWIIEAIKLFTLSKEELMQRMPFKDQALYDELLKQKRHIILAAGHFNNFEWAAQRITLAGDFDTYGLYTPLSNRYFNRFISKNRTRFGAKLIVAKEVSNVLSQPLPKQSALGFVFDQSPRKESKVYWTEFLNQETACFTGVERYAIKLNAQVVFLYPVKIKRGQFELHMKLICDEPQLTHPFAITEAHTRSLEKIIQQYPEAWMWSHKRWKLKRENKNF